MGSWSRMTPRSSWESTRSPRNMRSKPPLLFPNRLVTLCSLWTIKRTIWLKIETTVGFFRNRWNISKKKRTQGSTPWEREFPKSWRMQTLIMKSKGLSKNKSFTKTISCRSWTTGLWGISTNHRKWKNNTMEPCNSRHSNQLLILKRKTKAYLRAIQS